MQIIRKATAASLLISLGVYALLSSNYQIVSMFLFAFGLFGICSENLLLFTGKCGYVIENNSFILCLKILGVNLISGYLIGLIFAYINPDLIEIAFNKCILWDCSISFLIKSILCGVIMFLAVDIFKKGTPLGIFFGIPLFIFCGFQHSIANVIIMGTALAFNSAIILCIMGNWFGSLLIWFLLKETN